jgi:DNA-binding XRE family transcriptional regulator
LREGFRSIEDHIERRERDPRARAAIERARKRIAEVALDADGCATLASLRLHAGLSQSKLAAIIGNSQSSYSLIEAGKRDILHSTFEKLVTALGVSRDELARAFKNTQEANQS